MDDLDIVIAAQHELETRLANNSATRAAAVATIINVWLSESLADNPNRPTVASGLRSTASLMRMTLLENPPGPSQNLIFGNGNAIFHGNQNTAGSGNNVANVDANGPASVPTEPMGPTETTSRLPPLVAAIGSAAVAATWFLPTLENYRVAITVVSIVAVGSYALVAWLLRMRSIWEKRVFFGFAGVLLIDLTISALSHGLVGRLQLPPPYDGWIGLLPKAEEHTTLSVIKVLAAIGFGAFGYFAPVRH